ncbi:dienelactone hydrolase family protein [Mesorhizobium sp. WSM2561]|uniref:dienelactone hydrolase family protein n=1 Tax=Mesorhizobium sp. WSM2561 TaxID=1040985 RepID=UPI0006884752|nr:dienelactone hydrolase family protein [Mesorhizobium sp. WSM2561]
MRARWIETFGLPAFLRKAARLLLCGIIGCLGVFHSHADQLVKFKSATSQPTPFQTRMARQRGEEPKVFPGVPIQGFLGRPAGDGPFPAVVLLHGCAGLGLREREAWSRRLSSWGYVVLAVDSFTTRGIRHTCDRLLYDRVNDAYGALEFLTTLGFVDSRRVALMGFSAGGIAVLQAVQLGAAEALMKQKFQAAIAYYPSCSAMSGEMAVPTLILVGECDDWTPASACRKMMERRSGKGSPLKLIVYPDAPHAFDAENLKTGISSFGHFLQYNELAAKRSFQDSHVFLSETLGH